MSWFSKAIDKVLPGAPARNFTENTFDKIIKPEQKDQLEAIAAPIIMSMIGLPDFLGNATGLGPKGANFLANSLTNYGVTGDVKNSLIQGLTSTYGGDLMKGIGDKLGIPPELAGNLLNLAFSGGGGQGGQQGGGYNLLNLFSLLGGGGQGGGYNFQQQAPQDPYAGFDAGGMASLIGNLNNSAEPTYGFGEGRASGRSIPQTQQTQPAGAVGPEDPQGREAGRVAASGSDKSGIPFFGDLGDNLGNSKGLLRDYGIPIALAMYAQKQAKPWYNEASYSYQQGFDATSAAMTPYNKMFGPVDMSQLGADETTGGRTAARMTANPGFDSPTGGGAAFDEAGFRENFGSNNPEFDYNGDGTVSLKDWQVFQKTGGNAGAQTGRQAGRDARAFPPAFTQTQPAAGDAAGQSPFDVYLNKSLNDALYGYSGSETSLMRGQMQDNITGNFEQALAELNRSLSGAGFAPGASSGTRLALQQALTEKSMLDRNAADRSLFLQGENLKRSAAQGLGDMSAQMAQLPLGVANAGANLSNVAGMNAKDIAEQIGQLAQAYAYAKGDKGTTNIGTYTPPAGTPTSGGGITRGIGGTGVGTGNIGSGAGDGLQNVGQVGGSVGGGLNGAGTGIDLGDLTQPRDIFGNPVGFDDPSILDVPDGLYPGDPGYQWGGDQRVPGLDELGIPAPDPAIPATPGGIGGDEPGSDVGPGTPYQQWPPAPYDENQPTPNQVEPYTPPYEMDSSWMYNPDGYGRAAGQQASVGQPATSFASMLDPRMRSWRYPLQNGSLNQAPNLRSIMTNAIKF